MHKTINESYGIINKNVGYRYLLSSPDNIDVNKKYPLIVYLSSAGCRGSIEAVKQESVCSWFKNHIPFYVLAPVCPHNEIYDPDSVKYLIDKTVAENPIDINRLYVSGYSMGSRGCHNCLSEYPDLFAASVIVCGVSSYLVAAKYAHVPIHLFHGDKDEVVSINESLKIFHALREHGGNPKFQVLKGFGHDIYEEVYGSTDTYRWLLSHSKKG
jgi:predicted peptidase